MKNETNLAGPLLSFSSRGSLLLSLRSSLSRGFGRSLLGLLSRLLRILLGLCSSSLSSFSLLLNSFLGSLLRVSLSFGGSPLSLLLGCNCRFLGLLALRQNVLIVGLSSSTPVSLLGPRRFARGAAQGLLASRSIGTHVKADLVGMVAARSATDKRVKVVRAGLVADGAVSVDRLGHAVSQKRVGVHLSDWKREGLQVGEECLKLSAEERVLPAKGLRCLQGEGQDVCWWLDNTNLNATKHRQSSTKAPSVAMTKARESEMMGHGRITYRACACRLVQWI
jgi:hypothetical protein